MIFKPEMVAKILDGSKTQTRRPVQYESWTITERATGIRRPEIKLCRYRVGQTYAVQPGRTAKGVARIRVLDVTLERLDDITSADARAEGFSGFVEFNAYWKRLYGSFDDAMAVWRITFERVKHLR